MTFTKKQANTVALVGTIFVGVALSPAYGAVFAALMFVILTA